VRELHLSGVEGVCSGVHGRISMTKPLEFLFQIVVPPKYTIRFLSNLKKHLFRRCKRLSVNFNIIGLAVRELHLPRVKGVCSGVHGRIFMTKPLEFYFK
jgi:hypothetical protein